MIRMDTIQIYYGGVLRRGWRWRYIAAGNGARMANGGEAYADKQACVEGLTRVCGLPSAALWAMVSSHDSGVEAYETRRREVEPIRIEVVVR